jgi:hypothetical protein
VNPLLPAVIPTRLGAVLSGRSLRSFKRDLEPLCRAAGGISLSALESRLGVYFEPAAYLAAERRLDALRARERHSKRTAT